MKSENRSSEKMTTVTEAINWLRSEGYVEDFELVKNGVQRTGSTETIPASSLQMDKVFRFEGDSNPSDEAAVYALSSKASKLKGIIVDSYGAYSSPQLTETLSKIRRA